VIEVATTSKPPAPLDSARALSAMLALLVAEREDQLADNTGNGTRKTELILANSGLNANEIALLVGKNVEAVRKTLQRGKGKRWRLHRKRARASRARKSSLEASMN
jgi:DNA-directed RNA polymerase specialized sigma24 family protein